MRSIARAVAAAGIAVGLVGGVAPAAMADIVLIKESGPGDVAYNHVEKSHHVAARLQDKSVNVDDILTKTSGKQNTLAFEVEGSEQDQGEKD